MAPLQAAHTFSVSTIAYKWMSIPSGGKKASIMQNVVETIDATQPTLQLGFYFGQKLDHGPTVFSVPAGVVASVLKQPYETKEDKNKFVVQCLEAEPIFHAHFTTYTKKKQMQEEAAEYASSVVDGKLRFYIPGEQPPNADLDELFFVLDPKNDPKNSTYCFLTAQFAMHLIALHSEEFAFLLSVLQKRLEEHSQTQESENEQPQINTETYVETPAATEKPTGNEVQPYQAIFDHQNQWVDANHKYFHKRKEMEAWELEKQERLLGMREREFELRRKQSATLKELGQMTDVENQQLRSNILYSAADTVMRGIAQGANSA